MAKDASGRTVAIKKVRKTLSLDPLLCERLTAEANILRRIAHPNVVGVLDGGVTKSGQPFLVMARAFGQQLDSTIEPNGLSPQRVSNITTQLLDGLAAIHDAGVVHGDLKSSNVLVDELDRVTIVDFGLARLHGTAPADDEIFGGTPSYMAPELLEGHAPTIASDIYAAGVVIYELLTGTTPLPRTMSAMILLARRRAEKVDAPSKRAPGRGISPALDAVLLRALAPNAADRFSSATELAIALSGALGAWGTPVEQATSYWKRQPTAENVAPTIRNSDDVDGIIQRALDAVGELVSKSDTNAAIGVLEAALVRLQPTNKAVEIAAQAWRLETVLSALYANLGKRDHAVRLARLAVQHAQRSRDSAAVARATNLLERFAPPTRIARGSRAPMGRTLRRRDGSTTRTTD